MKNAEYKKALLIRRLGKQLIALKALARSFEKEGINKLALRNALTGAETDLKHLRRALSN